MPRKGAAKTYTSLLKVAGDIFAGKGYRDTTIADICERAGTNIASINYHFGNKENLYREAWRRSFLQSVKTHPPDGGVSEDAPAKERLRGQILALLRRITDQNNREFLIVQKELANPTGLLDQVIQEEIRPLQERMRGVIRELLGPQISDRFVRFCEISVISQCINPMVVRSAGPGKRAREKNHPPIADIEAYAGYVVQFSLGGIAAIRKSVEKKEKVSRVRK